MTFLKNIIKICFLIDIIGEKFSLFNIYKFIQLLIKRRETLIELFMLILFYIVFVKSLVVNVN